MGSINGIPFKRKPPSKRGSLFLPARKAAPTSKARRHSILHLNYILTDYSSTAHRLSGWLTRDRDRWIFKFKEVNGERPRQWSRIRGFGLGNSGSESRYENAGGQHGQRHRTGIATLALNLISFLSLSLVLALFGDVWSLELIGLR